jgi:hypothetical protein
MAYIRTSTTIDRSLRAPRRKHDLRSTFPRNWRRAVADPLLLGHDSMNATRLQAAGQDSWCCER